MKTAISLALLSAFLCACSSQDYGVQHADHSDTAVQAQPAHLNANAHGVSPVSQLTANEFSQALVHDLMANTSVLNEGGMIAVTDFAYVDTGLDQGSVLSNHLSEAMIYDLLTFGAPVVDFKVTDYIRVTPGGDFVLSRDFSELSAEVPIRYVVSGTMTLHAQGVLINARLIQIDNKRVVSAARTFMPKAVADAIVQRQSDDKLKLKQG